jgi:chromosome segregation ATPase
MKDKPAESIYLPRERARATPCLLLSSSHTSSLTQWKRWFFLLTLIVWAMIMTFKWHRSESRITALLRHYHDQRTHLYQTEKAVTIWQNRAESAESTLRGQKLELNSWRKKGQSALAQQDTLTKKLQHTKESLAELKLTAEENATQAENFRQEVETQAQALLAQKSLLDAAAEQKEENQQLRTTAEKALHKVVLLTEHSANLDAEIVNTEDQLSQLQQNLYQKENEVCSLQQKLSELKNENQNLCSSLASKESRIHQLECELNNLRNRTQHP